TNGNTPPGLRLGSRFGHYFARRLSGRREAIRLSALALLVIALTVVGGCQTSVPSSQPSPTVPNPRTPQIELPFTGLNSPGAVAVDAAANVYIVDYLNGRVLKLPAGSNTSVELPFTSLREPNGVAVDTVGNVYVADYGNNRVLNLPAGSTTPDELPFTGLKSPQGVAVDTDGNVYVGDYGNNRVLKLPAGGRRTGRRSLPLCGNSRGQRALITDSAAAAVRRGSGWWSRFFAGRKAPGDPPRGVSGRRGRWVRGLFSACHLRYAHAWCPSRDLKFGIAFTSCQ